ncbi:proliferating cell nuclear antigen, C-terminal domain-containing protein [Lenzites betulinus]|nr:proliferating cell nuclear antigen, C-terminal domain-containing protein [Lenzites betulinus]
MFVCLHSFRVAVICAAEGSLSAEATRSWSKTKGDWPAQAQVCMHAVGVGRRAQASLVARGTRAKCLRREGALRAQWEAALELVQRGDRGRLAHGAEVHARTGDGEREAQGWDDEDEGAGSGGAVSEIKKECVKEEKGGEDIELDADTDEDNESEGVQIKMNQAVTLTFSLKYLVNFSKSSALSKKVQLMMSNDVPLLVLYGFNQGHIRYYLAPKIVRFRDVQLDVLGDLHVDALDLDEAVLRIPVGPRLRRWPAAAHLRSRGSHMAIYCGWPAAAHLRSRGSWMAILRMARGRAPAQPRALACMLNACLSPHSNMIIYVFQCPAVYYRSGH